MERGAALMLGRRAMMAGLAAGFATRAGAEAPLVSPVPPLRPVAAALPPVEGVIAEARLGGEVTFALADMKTGALIAARKAAQAMPPASTVKAITALYALERLGRGHRFRTRVMASGPLGGGRVAGDLILAGGGDPALSTDHLGDMAAALAARGVRAVAGRFLVWAGALPYVAAIDRDQPEWLGYNPSVSGLNLNFNRVNFVWTRAEGGYELGFDARAERFAPPVTSARMAVVERDLPVYTYAGNGTTEDWTVASTALGKGGSRWLPVRRPDLYAGDVFRTLCRGQGIDLPAPEVLGGVPDGAVLVEHQGEPLPEVLRDMMKYSTNMTAEAVGMAASRVAGISSHRASGEAMGQWLHAAIGRGGARFADHSGLGGGSRISAADMVEALVRLGPGAGLAGLMKAVKFKGVEASGPLPARAVCKTGTLNFVSALVGYFTNARGEERAYAIFAADLARRDAVPDGAQENPPGVSAWLKRARRLQLQLLSAWG
jgi:D-alanyl-D-alanine carboxypeptidase/D-alanyl-D-alanine-endopeptidase (penicillin-binding protein 4)